MNDERWMNAFKKAGFSILLFGLYGLVAFLKAFVLRLVWNRVAGMFAGPEIGYWTAFWISWILGSLLSTVHSPKETT